VRESPALDILALLQEQGAHVSFHDPHVERLFTHEGKPLLSVPLARLDDYDCVVIVTNHSSIDYGRLVAEAKLVVDTRNATKTLRRDFPGRVVPL
jgi:UDP-N-acetyl-D-glucosamine dehydrogenase